MAQRVEIFKVTCNANTAQSAAVETVLTFDPGIVREVEIVIPDGHAGLTGIALAVAHQVTIPATGTAWIVGNDEVVRWPLDKYLNTGAWSAFAYNTDITNSHSWYLRFLIDEIAPPVSLTLPAPVAAGAIVGAGA